MKKTLLLTGVLLALTASIASAGLNLAWNNCYPASNAVSDKSPACDATSVFDTETLVGSLITGFAVLTPQFTGAQNVVDIQSYDPAGNDFWRLAQNECRVGSLNVFFAFGSAITSCSKTLYGPSTNFFPVIGWTSGFGQPNRYRLRAGCARTPGGAIAATTQYVTFEADFDMNHTDQTDTSTPYCAGCREAACVVYNSCGISKSDGSETIVSGPATRDWATWQGGVLLPPSICPTSVPTKRATWGQVKSLYR